MSSGFSRHEIICADGTPTESFFAREVALAALSQDGRADLADIFAVQVVDGGAAHTMAAAPMVRFRDAQRVADFFISEEKQEVTQKS